MIFKSIKIAAVAAAGVLLVGGLLFGTDLASYVKSSAKSVRTAVKDAVPIEFELQRARDLLEDIIPELHANVRLIAQEEVEVATLKAEIDRHREALAAERARIQKIRGLLAAQRVSYVVGENRYSRRQLKDDLARRFDRYREAEVVLAGKRRLLTAREKSLQAAVQMLERSRTQKVRLEDRIAGLESQYRLLKAASVGSRIQLDNSKLAQTEKLIRAIKKRLDVAERILAHETQFVQEIPVDAVSEKDLLAEVDEYFSAAGPRAATADEKSIESSGTDASPERRSDVSHKVRGRERESERDQALDSNRQVERGAIAGTVR